MSEHMRIQSELNTDLEVYRLKGELLELREQNRVLTEALERLAILGNEPFYGNSAGNVIAQKALGLPATVYMTKQAALPATSQLEPCTNHFSDGSKIFPSRDCCKPATSQEGQHESR